jgi:hypothetical protein
MGIEMASRLHTEKAEVPDIFPIDETEGFYCGTCHDPHIQPDGKTDGHGDYLRGNGAGETHNRNSFCRQCHPKNGETAHIHSTDDGDDAQQCEACHRPHDGYPSPDPRIRALTFLDKLEDRPVFTFPSPREPIRYRENPAEYEGSDKYEDPCKYEGPDEYEAPRRYKGPGEYYESSKCMECHFSDDHPDAPSLGRHFLRSMPSKPPIQN